MAEKTRLEISQSNNASFPTNNSKFITAKKLRDFEEIINESKFNLLDDSAEDVNFSSVNFTATDVASALEELRGVSGILVNGTVSAGDIGGGTSGSIVVTGDITSCTKVNYTPASSNSSYFTVNFVDLGTTEYRLILNIVGLGDRDNDDSLRGWIMRDQTSSSFKIGIEEDGEQVQNLKLLITLIAV